jgi:hypothetical protein
VPASEAPPGGPTRPHPDEERPPLLGSWRMLYAAVIGELLLVIAFCHWLTGWQR